MTIPDIYYNPFNKMSVHHRPIGAGAQWGTPPGYSPSNRSQLMEAAKLGQRGRLAIPGIVYNLSTGPRFDKPHLHNDTSIPGAVRTVQWNGAGSGKNLPRTLRLPIDVGLEAFPPPSADSNPGVFDVPSGIYNLFYGYEDATPSARILNRYPLTGLDYPGQDSWDRGSSASSIRWPSTTFHFWEISASNPEPIHHPFNVAVTRTHSNQNLQLVSPWVTWPALTTDSVTSTTNKGDIPYGTLVAVRPQDYTWLLNNYSWTNRQKVILDQQRYYGTYIVDGGNTATRDGVTVPRMSVRCGQGFGNSTAPIRTEVNEAFERIRPFLWPLVNGRGFASETETWTNGLPYRGGGGPIDANSVNTAYDAGDAPPPPPPAEAAMPTLITAGAWEIVSV